MAAITGNLRVIWACMKKDMRSALTERVFLIAGIFMPVNVLLMMSLFVLAGSHAPTAVVMHDTGPYAQAFYRAMDGAHSFSLSTANAEDAQNLITEGKVVAVVTIPSDFDARVRANEPVQIGVQINNLNTDFTNDIRRAIPLSITSFYGKAFPNLVTVTPHEIDWYPQTTDYIPYLGVSILVISVMVGSLLQSGTSSAKEWESGTIKELLLSPASRWSILVGKMLGAIAVSLLAVILVVAVVVFVLGVWPTHWDEVIWVTLLSLLIFIALGTLLGTLIKRWQPVVALAFALSVPMFFISGAFGPISFQVPVTQVIAKIFPVYYAIVLQQHAFHSFDLNTFGVGLNAAILMIYALGLLVLTTLALRRSTIAH
ncbi:MAG TPA: ABC transporter permease [Ktedonosporobacter sp.]|jgi:ABC-type multidrug transport system permease subunit|nr:ABC transporter permease [Ktedonosporobacter sp.]